MIIIGISSYFHDSAVTIIKNDKVLFAAQEERYSRIKHDSDFPKLSLKNGLDYLGIKISEVDYVVYHEKPLTHFERLFETSLSEAPKGYKMFKASVISWIKDKLLISNKIIDELKKFDKKIEWKSKLKFSNHHLSHASSAFFPSPFENALVVCIDGVGEWATTSIFKGKNNQLTLCKQINFPHSLGLLYTAFTYYCGFKVNSGEYKLMGLAPYGKPVYANLILEKIISIKEDGSYTLNSEYFGYTHSLKMITEKFCELFGNKERPPETEITQFYMDIAASIQRVLEDSVLKLIAKAMNEFKESNLCLAGGVALNCVANGKISELSEVKNIWIQPASGDAGCSLGAALAYGYLNCKLKRDVNLNDSMEGSYLGNSYTKNEIKGILDKIGAKYFYIEDEVELLDYISDLLIDDYCIGLHQGRMEFGPRALGNRSIISNAIKSDVQKNLNLKIKFRESFRPFAPIVLESESNKYFKMNGKISPYMLLVYLINDDQKLNTDENDKKKGFDKLYVKRSAFPAITHVDYSARIQTVSEKRNGRLFKLLTHYYKKSKIPILANTSFNVRGEPIVESPADAFNCFNSTNMDALVIENFILLKKDQTVKSIDYKHKYELD
jgi:carbamoyltransferase